MEKIKPKVCLLSIYYVLASLHTLKLTDISEECSEVGATLLIFQIQNWYWMWLFAEDYKP